jgi:hypothetical protein
MTEFSTDEMERFKAELGESYNLPEDSEIEVILPNGERTWLELKTVRIVSIGGPVMHTSYRMLTREVAIRAMLRLKTRKPEKSR